MAVSFLWFFLAMPWVGSTCVIVVLISYYSFLLQRCKLPDRRCLSHGMCLYQVMMKLHVLNDVVNDIEFTRYSIITS